MSNLIKSTIQNGDLVNELGLVLTGDQRTWSQDLDTYRVFNNKIQKYTDGTLSVESNNIISDPANDYVAFWDFPSLTSKPTGYNLVNYGATETDGVKGGSDRAYYFNGTQRMQTGGIVRANDTKTISYWFKGVSGGNYFSTISTRGDTESQDLSKGFLVLTRANEILYGHIAVGNFTTPYAFNENEWYYFVVTTDTNGTNIRFYVNGDAVGTVGMVGTAVNETYFDTHINRQGTNGFGKGSLDNLMFYSKILAPDEIKEIYNSQKLNIDSNTTIVHTTTNIYALYEGVVVEYDTSLTELNRYNVAFTGIPLKAQVLGGKVIFNTTTKLYSYDLVSSDLVSISLLDSFHAGNNLISRLLLDTTIKIKRLNISLIEQSSLETTLPFDTINIQSFYFNNFDWFVTQSITDNNIKIVKADATTYTSAVLIGITIGTITGAYPVKAG